MLAVDCKPEVSKNVFSEQQPFQEFIYVRTYSRWVEEFQRRETYPESVDRAIDFFAKHIPQISSGHKKLAREAMLNFEVMGSMRALWAAGKAAENNSLALYNCSYLTIKDIFAFSEILFLLMCGTGVGFSVERRFIQQLPEIQAATGKLIKLQITDSKEGWAAGLNTGLLSLWEGHDLEVDYTLVRPRGSRLKTMGGRASGPEPLCDLFTFAIALFNNKRQQKLNRLQPIDCLDLVTKIAEIVVVGGVRRSSLICIFDNEDKQVAEAKTGEFWREKPHRAMSNNSAVFESKPSLPTFMEQWLTIIKSGSGEPGIFNRNGALKQMGFSGRRKLDPDVGTNPCVTENTLIHTADGPKQVKDLLDTPFMAEIDGKTYHSDGFWCTGNKPVFVVTTNEGYSIELTDNHKILVINHLTRKSRKTNWKMVAELEPGDKICLHDHRLLGMVGFAGRGTLEEGWLLGSLLGDGNISNKIAQLSFWGETSEEMSELALASVHSTVGARSDCNGSYREQYDRYNVGSANLLKLAKTFHWYETTSKIPNTEIEKTSSEFHRGFLCGWFDADGTVGGTQTKGISVRLASSRLESLYVAQRMLARLGIISTIYKNRKSAGHRPLPDGKGGKKLYWCKATHELCISDSNLAEFAWTVGFRDPNKKNKLTNLLVKYKRKLNRERFYATVSNKEYIGHKPVYDCNVADINAFDGNGIYLHNCGEILLRGGQLCNLSEVVVRAQDTLEDLKRKIRIAAMLGSWQATQTNFPYVREQWAENCKEERLLGVSLTGIMDHPVLNNVNDTAKKWLAELKHAALRETAKWSKKLDINMSVAVTCVKPSGTVSQLVNCSSGMHCRWSKYYIRRYRISATDPLFKMLRDQGVPCHPEVSQEASTASTWVLEFPVESPDECKTRHDYTAIEQLEHWKMIKEFYTEHNPSVTIYVDENEWLEVGAWCYKNFDYLVGVAFLPKSNHVYHLAPYEEISKEQYNELAKKFPKIDYSKLNYYETEDNTSGAQNLACVAGVCDI